MNQEFRHQPTVEEMRRWARQQQTLLEWRRLAPREPRWDRVRKAGDLVEKCLGTVLPDDELPCAEAVGEAWAAAAGEFNARHARPGGWQKGELIIEVDHPALRFELTQHRRQLLERMRERLAPTRIKGLRLRLVG